VSYTRIQEKKETREDVLPWFAPNMSLDLPLSYDQTQ